MEVQIAHDRSRARHVYFAILGLTFIMGIVAVVRAPEPFPVALLVLVLACVAAFFRPVVGVYVLVFLTMVGDTVTMEWWPFTKNMSSRESIFFVNDQLFLSPLELLAGVTVVAWLIRQHRRPDVALRPRSHVLAHHHLHRVRRLRLRARHRHRR